MTTSTENSAVPVVAASELATFAFCPRAWQWQYQEGRAPAPTAVARGRTAHREHAARVFGARRLLVTVSLLALLALAGLAGAWWVLGGRP